MDTPPTEPGLSARPVTTAEAVAEAVLAAMEAKKAAKQATKSAATKAKGNAAPSVDEDGEPLPVPLSDAALGEYWVKTYGSDWRYVHHWKKWLRWHGDTWEEDATSYAKHLAMGVVRAAAHWPEARELTAEGKRKLSSYNKAGNCLSVAQCHPDVAALVDQWDTDPWMLGVPGGVIDLRTGEMLEGRREDYIRLRTAVAPAPRGSRPPAEWLRYLTRACADDAGLIGYLQRWCGYCMTGLVDEHALCFLHGSGRNGKGTFLRTLGGILGGYAKVAGMETFTESRNGPGHPTELARLAGARLVITDETASGGRWNETRIKNLTGGGKITAHFMAQDDFEYECQFKLLISGNNLPRLSSVDEAVKARFHLVPFTVFIPPEERDPRLYDKLMAEWPLIMRWMLDGLEAWQEQGLRPSSAIQEASRDYMDDQDLIGEWRTDCCEDGPKHLVPSSDLYRSYVAWCQARQEKPIGKSQLTEALCARGCTMKRTATARFILGLRLRPVEDRLQGAGELSGVDWE